MKKVISVLSVVLLGTMLAACMGSSGLQQDPTVNQFYTLDKEKLKLCRGTGNQCQNLILIASAQEFLSPVERAYGSKVQGPNYPLSLARLIMEPPQGQYQATPIGDSGRLVRLPINRLTDSVWQALEKARNTIYD